VTDDKEIIMTAIEVDKEDLEVFKQDLIEPIEPYNICNRYSFCQIMQKKECNYYVRDFELDFDTSDDKDSDIEIKQ
jgi:hypothetical protein